jgi:16S rRNA C967 or C1407 C5-methylase (RsmB/RsmF family)
MSEPAAGDKRIAKGDVEAPTLVARKPQGDIPPQFRFMSRKPLLESPLLEHFYRTTIRMGYPNMTEAEADAYFADYLATMRRPLPITFRISGDDVHAAAFRDLFQAKFAAKLAELPEDALTLPAADDEPPQRIVPPSVLPWYPKNLGWQFDVPKVILRKRPEFKTLHLFTTLQHDCGAITRQEAVSMLPPLFLDVRAHHRVLDICAAPGSKTTQIVDALHADAPPGTLPAGLVVANDLDIKRCYLLVHNAMRRKSPSVVVTNNDAANYPEVLETPEPHPVTGLPQPLRFDRVNCDVPCCGDGTLRKSPDLWARYRPGFAHTLHKLQLQIAKRAARLLKVGGRMVYSTCSLNPVQDEAIVRALLVDSRGALRLVRDPTHSRGVDEALTRLHTGAPVSTWGVWNYRDSGDGEYLDPFTGNTGKAAAGADAGADDLEDDEPAVAKGKGKGKTARPKDTTQGLAVPGAPRFVKQPSHFGTFYTSLSQVPERWGNAFAASEFPDYGAGTISDIDGQPLDLDLTGCMRMWPHLQDTGGFFVAVLEKAAAVPWEPQTVEDWAEEAKLQVVQRAEREAADRLEIEKRVARMKAKGRATSDVGHKSQEIKAWAEMPLLELPEEFLREVDAVAAPTAGPRSLPALYRHWGIDPRFLPYELLACRVSDVAELQRLHLLSEGAKAFVLGPDGPKKGVRVSNEAASDRQTLLRVVTAGITVFAAQGSAKDIWRVPQSTLEHVAPCLTRRVVGPGVLSAASLEALLLASLDEDAPGGDGGAGQGVKFEHIENEPPAGFGDKQLADYLRSLRDSLREDGQGTGPVVLKVDADPERPITQGGVAVVGWLGADSLALHISRRERAAMLQLLANTRTDAELHELAVMTDPSARMSKRSRARQRKQVEKAQRRSERKRSSLEAGAGDDDDDDACESVDEEM